MIRLMARIYYIMLNLRSELKKRAKAEKEAAKAAGGGKEKAKPAGEDPLKACEKAMMPLVKNGDTALAAGDLPGALALYQEAMIGFHSAGGSQSQQHPAPAVVVIFPRFPDESIIGNLRFEIPPHPPTLLFFAGFAARLYHEQSTRAISLWLDMRAYLAYSSFRPSKSYSGFKFLPPCLQVSKGRS